MAFNFKEVMSKPERLAPGHRMCAGCGGTIAVRTVPRALHVVLQLEFVRYFVLYMKKIML